MNEEVIKYKHSIPIRVMGLHPPCENSLDDQKYINEQNINYKLSETHIHSEYEFLRINRGVLRCVTTDGEFIANKGDILFVNSYVPHCTYSSDNKVHHTILQFKISSGTESIIRYVSRFANISGASAYVFKKDSEEAKEIQNYFGTVITEYTSQNDYWNNYVYANVLLLISALQRKGIVSSDINTDTEKINKIKPVLEFINSNYTEDISNAQLSRILNFNENYFCRVFKNAVGTTPINYINFVRICKAEKLLKTDMNLLDIACATGFSSHSYFNRIFKKYLHYSPSEYRNIIKAE